MANKFSLVLLYNKISAATPVVHSLKEKGIDVFAVATHTDLVKFIQENHVDFVGLSVNHPNSANLAAALGTSNSSVAYFKFAEDALPLTVKKLAASPAEMKIIGVASAYTIWMSLGPIVKARGTNSNSQGKVILANMNSTAIGLGDVSVEESKITNAGGLIVQMGGEERLGMAATLNVKLLKDATLRALTPFHVKDASKSEKFPSHNKVTVFSVQNDDDDGLMIISSNGLDFVPTEHVDSFRSTLTSEMHNKNFQCGAAIDIDFKVSDICEWQRHYCPFTFTYQEGLNVQMVSFLICRDKIPKFVKAGNTKMFSLATKALPIDIALSCDLYLYFNRNEKLVPYVKQGDLITSEKLNRLAVSGIEEVHIREEDKSKLESLIFSLLLESTLKTKAKAL